MRMAVIVTIAPDIAAISQTNGTMINDNEGLEVPNAGQVPFPNPTHPQHYVWNYRMYAGTVSAVDSVQTSVTVQADGSITLGQQETSIFFRLTQIQKQCMRIKIYLHCSCRKTLDHQELLEQLL